MLLSTTKEKLLEDAEIKSRSEKQLQNDLMMFYGTTLTTRQWDANRFAAAVEDNETVEERHLTRNPRLKTNSQTKIWFFCCARCLTQLRNRIPQLFEIFTIPANLILTNGIYTRVEGASMELGRFFN